MSCCEDRYNCGADAQIATLENRIGYLESLLKTLTEGLRYNSPLDTWSIAAQNATQHVLDQLAAS